MRGVAIKICGGIKWCCLLLVGGRVSVTQAECLCGSGGGMAEDDDAKPGGVNGCAVLCVPWDTRYVHSGEEGRQVTLRQLCVVCVCKIHSHRTDKVETRKNHSAD